MIVRLLWIGVALTAAVRSQQTPSFEVVSVKPNDGRGGRGAKGGASGVLKDPTLLSLHNTTVKSLILRSYDIQDYQLSGGPVWIDNDRYDIEARPEHPTTQEQMMLMLRSLLADRFQLRTHHETKTLAAYVLTVAKGGPKFGPNFMQLNQGDLFPPSGDRVQLGGTLKNFVFLLRANMRMFDPATGPVPPGTDIPPILDRTGLTGAYSILVSDGTHKEWPWILDHQLGLKLDLRKEPIEVMVIDHVAKPSQN